MKIFNEQKFKRIYSVLSITAFVLVIFIAGVFAGYFTRIHLTSPKDAEFDKLFAPFYQAWDVVHEEYLEQPVDDSKLVQGAIKGMMESLGDPYSAYMDPDEYRQQNTPLQGEYTGVGAYVDVSGDALVFIAPMPDSPAEKVGVKTGDVVIKIDGEDMTGIDPSLVLKKILGPAGTTVTITVKREGSEIPLEFVIERAVITLNTVDHEMLNGQIGYIRLYTFGANTANEFNNAFNDLLDEGATGLIIDLRDNSGGYVDTAVEIASDFIPSGTILIEEWGDGTRNQFLATQKPISTDIPLVVLVNGGSASASEIVAGALQDYDRAELVGTKTYGKGLIQNWIELVNDSGAIRVTIARWLTPKEQQIQGNGLQPDHVVELTEENIQARYDAQLKTALNILMQKEKSLAENGSN
jgi:carboxyl-terminal processing protease